MPYQQVAKQAFSADKENNTLLRDLKEVKSIHLTIEVKIILGGCVLIIFLFVLSMTKMKSAQQLPNNLDPYL